MTNKDQGREWKEKTDEELFKDLRELMKKYRLTCGAMEIPNSIFHPDCGWVIKDGEVDEEAANKWLELNKVTTIDE